MIDADFFNDLTESLKDLELPQKTIWDELNEWGKKLEDWQRFIVSHAVRDGILTDDRVDEAFQLFLRNNALDFGNEELPDIPMSVTGRPDTSEISPLILKEMRALRNVNAIPETSSLTFGPGLTVIYGHNGAGKSGFARVLSAACFGRSDINIFPNIYAEEAPDTPATAEFLINKGEEKNEIITFKAGDEHADLRRFSVFDSSIARLRLGKEDKLGFQPAGFDVFDELIRVVGLIIKKLDALIISRTKPNKFNQLFPNPGRIAVQLANLNARCNIEDLRALGSFGQAEQDRLDEVERQEIELSAKSPIETIKALESAKTSIDKLKKKISELAEQLDEKTCAKVRAMLDNQRKAIANATKAGAETVKHPNLTTIGTDIWDDFIDASRTLGLAESDNYPSERNPCLLCHRPLDEPSVTLIKRMWGYLDIDARKHALAVDLEINTYVDQLRALELILLPEESQIRTDLSKITPDLLALLDGVSTTFIERRDTIVHALETGQTDLIPVGDLSLPLEKLTETLTDIEAREKTLKDGKFEEDIAKLKAEHVNLRQRQILSNNIEDVVEFIENLIWIENAEKAKPNPRFVTDKQKRLFKTLIEGAYKSRLEEECSKLDYTLPIEFKARGNIGKTLRGLKVKGGHNPEDIFSEGEQRALAIADFLTEINLNPASAAIVFDDPVTSMDHRRKELIAVRLAEEVRSRQVIVFTHDLVFLSKLLEAAERISVDATCHTVDWHQSRPGHVLNNESPANSQAYRDTKRAKEFLDRAKTTAGREKVDYIRQGAGALRKTIEEVVILHLFKGVVRRWNEEIRLGRISAINWSDEIADEVEALLDGTSRLIEGHSNSDEFTGAMPETDTLESLIQRVEYFIKKVRPERVKHTN